MSRLFVGLRRAVTMPPWAPVLPMAAISLAAAPAVFHAMFSGFLVFDDEGYLLLALREYARGGVLYDEVFSQYGPAYHQVLAAVFRLAALDYVHVHGRAVVLVLWLTIGLVCAAVTYRVTRSVLLTCATQLVALQALVPMRYEPPHPGGLLALFVAAIALAGCSWGGGGVRGRVAAWSGGGLLALAVLTKINVGGLALIATGYAVLAGVPRGAALYTSRLATTAAFLAIPLALAPAVWHPDVRALLAVALAAAGGTVLLADRAQPPPGHPRAVLAPLLAAFTVVVTVSLGWEAARGTTLAGLVDGLVLGPSRHPLKFLDPKPLPFWTVAYTAGWLGLAAVMRAVRPPGAGVLLALAGPARIAVGAMFWLALSDVLPADALVLAPPAFWVALVPPEASPLTGGRLVLVATAALQVLHAYPVGGSQVAWATFLAAPIGGILLADGWRATRAALAARSGTRPPRWIGAVAALALTAGVLANATNAARRLAHEYNEGVPLGLPGAETVRVTARQAAVYRQLARSLTTQCSTFFTQPGLNSLYLFTQRAPPTRMNATAWMDLFDDAQQVSIMERLAALPGPVCVVVIKLPLIRETPLTRYIEEHFETQYRMGAFEFRVPREAGGGRHSAAPSWRKRWDGEV